uniref:Uncharacterized protein n=1 Tax=Arundo donax TaxID=35708 RepID=A0A0A8Y5C9_ARUDO
MCNCKEGGGRRGSAPTARGWRVEQHRCSSRRLIMTWTRTTRHELAFMHDVGRCCVCQSCPRSNQPNHPTN